MSQGVLTEVSRPAVRPVTVLAAASFAVIGGSLTLPGTLLPLLLERLGISLVEAGSMLAAQPVAYLVTVMAAWRLIGRLGMRAVLSLGVLTYAAGFAGFGLVSTWRAGAAMLFVSGLGFGAVEVAINTLLINVGGERRANLLNLTHLFFGLGAFVWPVVTAQAVVAGVSWRWLFLAAGGVMGVVALGWGVQPLGGAGESVPPATRPSQQGVYSRLTLMLAVLLGLYVGCDLGIGGWLTKYMVTERGVNLTYAGNSLSLYWLALASGRLVLSFPSLHVRQQRLLVGLPVVATAALTAALLVHAPWICAVCFAATGLGFSGIFPAVIALGGQHHPHDVAGATSVVVAGAALGGIVFPWTMSAIADAVGLTAGMGFYASLCAAMVVLAIIVDRMLAVQTNA